MFGLTLKGKHVYTGYTNVFELKLMDCFTYVNGVMMLKLPSGKLIKSCFNQPKPLAPLIPEALPVPVLPLVPETMPETLLDTKPIDPMYNLPHVMDNIVHPDDQPFTHQAAIDQYKGGFFSDSARVSTYIYCLSPWSQP